MSLLGWLLGRPDGDRPAPRDVVVVCLALVGVILWMTGVFTGLDYAALVHGFESDLSPVLRYSRTLICVALAFACSLYPLGLRDRRLIRLAFLLTGAADFFVILHPEKMLIGMGIFMLVHITLAIRHAQGWRESMEPPNRDRTVRWLWQSALWIGIPGVALLYFAAPMLHKSGMFWVDLVYLVVLMISAWMGWGTLVRPFFPNFNARIIAIGMTFFFLCDVALGLSHAAGADSKLGELMSLVPDLTYSWALLGLALSASRWGEDPPQARPEPPQ